MKDTNRLSSKVALITGGGSGLGKATALHIAKEGAAAALLDIRLSLVERVAEEINASAGRALAIACDVADEEQVSNAVRQTVDHFGEVTSLLANADTAGRVWIHETTLEDWQLLLDVNLASPFLCSKPLSFFAIGGNYKPMHSRMSSNH